MKVAQVTDNSWQYPTSYFPECWIAQYLGYMPVLSTQFSVSHRTKAHSKTAWSWTWPSTGTHASPDACVLAKSAIISSLIMAPLRGIWQEDEVRHGIFLYRPHHGAAPRGLSGVCRDEYRIQLISNAGRAMRLPHQCLPHQACKHQAWA